jgi:hypothetical protein
MDELQVLDSGLDSFKGWTVSGSCPMSDPLKSRQFGRRKWSAAVRRMQAYGGRFWSPVGEPTPVPVRWGACSCPRGRLIPRATGGRQQQTKIFEGT